MVEARQVNSKTYYKRSQIKSKWNAFKRFVQGFKAVELFGCIGTVIDESSAL